MASRADVRIGATGHRVLTDVARLRRGIEQALDRIQSAYPDRALTILSSLAEGADRLTAEAVLRRPNGKLVAVLPQMQPSYTTDFGPEGSPSRLHFDALLARTAEVTLLTPCPDRAGGYEQAGCYVADQCDVLLALWDGQAAQGRGGTAHVVERARALQIPVVIVRTGNRRPGGLEPTTLGSEQGRVLVEGQL